VYFIVLPVAVPFNIITIIIITILLSSFFTFFLFSRLYVLCVHYRFVRFSYYTGDQFIEPRMAPLVAFRCCRIMIIMYCSLLYVAENKLAVVVVLWNTEGAKRQGIYCTVKNV